MLTGEACRAVEILVKLSRAVVGDFSAVLEPGQEGVNDGERCIGGNTGFVDGGVGNRIHLGQGLGEGGSILELEEILKWHVVA